MTDQELKETVSQFRLANGSKRAAAKSIGVSRSTLRKRLKKAAERGLIDWDEIQTTAPPEVQCTVHYKTNGGTIEIITPTVPEPEEIFERSGVNPDNWEIYDIRIQDWSTPMKVKKSHLKDNKVLVDESSQIITNYLVSVKIRPKKSAPFDKAMRELVENLPKRKPPVYRPYPMLHQNLAGELIPVDAHIAKLAWHPETGQGDMDLKISVKKYMDGVTKSLTHLSNYNPSEIIYVIGNDFMHFENINAETFKAGHHLDSDGRLPKVIRAATDCAIDTIDMSLQVAPTRLVFVPGNHDHHANMWLAELIWRLYKDHKHITVDPSPCNHKHYVFGDTLLVWMHDATGAKKNRAINHIPHAYRQEWGQTRWAEVHFGHKHKKEEWNIFQLSSPGQCVFRQCSGLSTIDYWHFENLFTDAVPASEAFLIDAKHGVEANFTSNLDYTEGEKVA